MDKYLAEAEKHSKMIEQKVRIFFEKSRAMRSGWGKTEECFTVKFITFDNKADFWATATEMVENENYFCLEFVEYNIKIEDESVYSIKGIMIKDDSFLI